MADMDWTPAGMTAVKDEEACHNLHRFFSSALAHFSQSPLSPATRNAGINILFDLLHTAHLAAHPLLHAMTHTAIAVNTPFNKWNNCQYKLDHLEKAQEIVLSLLRERHGLGKEGACQGCLYARARRDWGKGKGEEDASECGSLGRLCAVIEGEGRRVTEFNWRAG